MTVNRLWKTLLLFSQIWSSWIWCFLALTAIRSAERSVTHLMCRSSCFLPKAKPSIKYLVLNWGQMTILSNRLIPKNWLPVCVQSCVDSKYVSLLAIRMKNVSAFQIWQSIWQITLSHIWENKLICRQKNWSFSIFWPHLQTRYLPANNYWIIYGDMNISVTLVP